MLKINFSYYKLHTLNNSAKVGYTNILIQIYVTYGRVFIPMGKHLYKMEYSIISKGRKINYKFNSLNIALGKLLDTGIVKFIFEICKFRFLAFPVIFSTLSKLTI